MTWRLNRQAEELEAVRLEEQRALRVAQLAQRMLATLERLRVRDARVVAANTEVAMEPVLLSAPLTEGRLSLPWELPPAPRQPSPTVESLLREGEVLEFQRARPDLAAARYAEAEAEAVDPSRQLDARLHLARSLGVAGRAEASERAWRRIVGASPTLLDEEGMPFVLYAAEALLAFDGDGPHQALSALESVAAAYGITPAAGMAEGYGDDRPRRFALPPSALAAMLELSEHLADRPPGHGEASESENDSFTSRARIVAQALEGEITVAERLRALRRDLSVLISLASTPDDRAPSNPGLEVLNSGVVGSGSSLGSVWQPYGPDPWLVAVAEGQGQGRIDVVESSRLFAALAADSTDRLAITASVVRVTTVPGPHAHLLGPSFPGLFATIPDEALPRPPRASGGSMLTWVVLPLVLMVTSVSAFLLLRDIRREAETASLRAQFVSSVSHELKTPLTSIRMFAETLLLGRREAPEGSREYLETIVHESERLSRLIDNVLDFSRIDRGERSYRFERTPLDTVIHGAARAMSYPLAQGRHELRVQVTDPPPFVRADPDALTQAILNLLSNAVKFSGAGETIDLELDRSGSHAVIRVRDRGRGIAEGELEAIFERFYRAKDAVSDGTPGTGLGLALVDHVVRAHGGTTYVESSLGRGSTFTIRLPEEQREADVTDQPSSMEDRS